MRLVAAQDAPLVYSLTLQVFPPRQTGNQPDTRSGKVSNWHSGPNWAGQGSWTVVAEDFHKGTACACA